MTSLGVITLFVEDEQRSKEFYERVFEVSATDEGHGTVIVELENLFLRLLARGAAQDEMGKSVTISTSERDVSFQLAIFVEDLEAEVAKLARNDVPLLFGPVDRPWGVRNVAFRDPDGHVWVLSADIPDGAGG